MAQRTIFVSGKENRERERERERAQGKTRDSGRWSWSEWPRMITQIRVQGSVPVFTDLGGLPLLRVYSSLMSCLCASAFILISIPQIFFESFFFIIIVYPMVQQNANLRTVAFARAFL